VPRRTCRAEASEGREGGRSSSLLRRCYLIFLPRRHRSPAKYRIAPVSYRGCCAACR
jgi:hypothetical protein